MAIFDDRDYSQFFDEPDPTDPTEPVPPPVIPPGGETGTGGGTMTGEKPPVPGPGYVPPPYGGPTRPLVGDVPLFDAPDFVQPDYAALTNDPAYLWRESRALGAMQASAAARGIVRTGGTQYNLGELASNMASQEIASAYDRAYRTYGLQYQAARDEYAPLLAEWGANNEANSSEFQRLWDMYVSNLNDQWRHDELVYRGGNETSGG